MDELMTDNVQVHHNPPQYKFALEAYMVACEYEDVKPFPKHPGVTTCDNQED